MRNARFFGTDNYAIRMVAGFTEITEIKEAFVAGA
jgi:hypothetical protein